MSEPSIEDIEVKLIIPHEFTHGYAIVPALDFKRHEVYFALVEKKEAKLRTEKPTYEILEISLDWHRVIAAAEQLMVALNYKADPDKGKVRYH